MKTGFVWDERYMWYEFGSVAEEKLAQIDDTGYVTSVKTLSDNVGGSF